MGRAPTPPNCDVPRQMASYLPLPSDSGLGKNSFNPFFASLLLAKSELSATDRGEDSSPCWRMVKLSTREVSWMEASPWDLRMLGTLVHVTVRPLSHIWKVVATRKGP